MGSRRISGETVWSEDQSCFIRIGCYELSTKIDTSAEAIEEFILNEIERKLSKCGLNFVTEACYERK